MALFRYRAVDREGNPSEGTLEETSARRVVLALEERGLTVNAVEEVDTGSKPPARKPRLTWEDLDEFNDVLLTIAQGGLPLAPAIAAMARDLRNRRLKPVLEGIRKDLEAGKTLEEALGRYPKSFPPIYTTLIRAGERAGNLSGVLETLSNYSKGMIELKNGLQEVLAYPLFLVVAACGLVYFLMVKVVPVFAEIFRDFGGQLPAPTRFLVFLSDLVSAYGIFFLAALAVFLAVIVGMYRGAPRTESRGYLRDWIRMYFPVFGGLYARASLVRFCRALGMLLDARVPLIESLHLAAAAAGNAVLGRAVIRGAEHVAGGTTLTDSLQRTGYFDHGFCWLLRNAEQRGETPRALIVLEEGYERSIDRMRKWTMLLVGPAVVIFIALMVGYIVVSLYLPIFSLGDVVSGH